MSEEKLTIEDQLKLNTALLNSIIERLDETAIQIYFLQSVVYGQYGFGNPLKHWSKLYGGTREDKNEDKKELILSKEDTEALLKTISVEEAKTFACRGGYLVKENAIDQILNILHKYDLTIQEAKHILALTKEKMDDLKL